MLINDRANHPPQKNGSQRTHSPDDPQCPGGRLSVLAEKDALHLCVFGRLVV